VFLHSALEAIRQSNVPQADGKVAFSFKNQVFWIFIDILRVDPSGLRSLGCVP
jgi:hypothetical protein